MAISHVPGFSNFTELAINNLTIREHDDQGNNIFAETVLFNPTSASATLVRLPFYSSLPNSG